MKGRLAELHSRFGTAQDHAALRYTGAANMPLGEVAGKVVETPAKQFQRVEDSAIGYVTVTAYGARGDGVTDDTAAFQAALNAAAGNKVYVPGGHYVINGTLSVPPYTVLMGTNEYPFNDWGHNNSQAAGSVLYAHAGRGSATGTPFIFLNGPAAGVKGMTLLYPDQDVNTAPPAVYPPCIQGSGNNLAVENMLLGNPWIGIDFATYSCPRHLISNVYGQPMYIGITVDQIYDIGRIRHIHFWPFWANAATPAAKWQHNNAITFLFLRSDWEVVEDVFSWGYSRGMTFNKSSHGALNGQFTDIDFDDVDVAIEIHSTQTPGILFSNLNIANAGNGHIKTGIRCPAGTGHGAEAVFRGLSVWGQFETVVDWQCPGLFAISSSLINQWNTNAGKPGMGFTDGRVSVQGNFFHHWGYPGGKVGVEIGPNVTRAIVTGNDFDGVTLTCPATSTSVMCTNNLL